MKSVIYSAAHSGFNIDRVPLGGAAAVCQALLREWKKTKPFDVQLLSPQILGSHAPHDKDLVQISELEYARFSRSFERAITERITKADPADSVVLSNDISEGPDFQRLAERGFSIYTIFHVDVVEYFVRMYLREWIKPEIVTRFYEHIRGTPLRHFFPDILGLVFQKQRDAVLYSRGLIVPSEGMRDVILRCYPQISSSKIHVIPWDTWPVSIDRQDIDEEKRKIREAYQLPEKAFTLLTLSRLSPEKGQDRLLKALDLWERAGNPPAEGVWLFLAGEAAYMKGKRFEKKLHKLAGRLKKIQVIFPGYASGARKQALFELAHLYVFPSRHESYGLTLLEAMQAGLPALACDNHGSRAVMAPEIGELLPAAQESEIPELLCRALQRLQASPGRLRQMSQAAKVYAGRHQFADAAARLAEILTMAPPPSRTPRCF